MDHVAEQLNKIQPALSDKQKLLEGSSHFIPLNTSPSLYSPPPLDHHHYSPPPLTITLLPSTPHHHSTHLHISSSFYSPPLLTITLFTSTPHHHYSLPPFTISLLTSTSHHHPYHFAAVTMILQLKMQAFVGLQQDKMKKELVKS